MPSADTDRTSLKISDTTVISIAGAGLAGTLLALRLAQGGWAVKLYERYPDPELEAVPSGRSINLALAERGRHALAQAGLLDTVDQISIAMAGRKIHRLDGEVGFQAYGQRPEEVIYSVHRDQLSRLLLQQARANPLIDLRFYHRLSQVDFAARRAAFIDDRNGQLHWEDYQVLLGTDGANSALRHAMDAVDGVQTQADLLDHAYREFTIPPTASGDFAIDPHALHIWPRGGFMLIALPNADRSFTATLFLAREGDPGFAQIPNDLSTWQAFLGEHFADALPLLTDLAQDLAQHPVGHMGTIRCPRWHLGGQSLILGDAAHAVVPFHGQGMNAAFEDVDEFISMLDQYSHWPELIEAFQQQRQPNTDALAAMALENYEEMRQGVRDPLHLQRKALEWQLEREFPGRFIPRYSMVMFHRLPYAQAMQRGALQRQLLDQLLALPESERLSYAEQWLEQHLPALVLTTPTSQD